MVDKEFELKNEQYLNKSSETDLVFSLEDLKQAYQAGFDFEEASFDEWFLKRFNNGFTEDNRYGTGSS